MLEIISFHPSSSITLKKQSNHDLRFSFGITLNSLPWNQMVRVLFAASFNSVLLKITVFSVQQNFLTRLGRVLRGGHPALDLNINELYQR